MIHLDPIVFTARWYDSEDGWANKEPYSAVATVQIMGDIALISALHGEMDHRKWRELKEALKQKGVTEAHTVRRKTQRVYKDE